MTKLVLAVFGILLAALCSATGWMVSYMLETRSIATLNTATLSANIAAQSSTATRMTAIEIEVHRIALIQAERTGIINRQQDYEDQRRNRR